MGSRPFDFRYFQIFFLTSLVIFGPGLHEFAFRADSCLSVLLAGVLLQLLAIFLWQLPLQSILSALISALSIVLLLRSQTVVLPLLATLIAIGSKFLFTYKQKHFFNPSNFGIILTLLLTDHAWLSPGQWGRESVLIFLVLGIGGFMLFQLRRIDTCTAFLGTTIFLLVARIIILGEPLATLLHRVSTGSLLIFAFFMITDPRSTPDHHFARVIFGCCVALLSYLLQFHFYITGAPLWALFFLSPVTLWLDKLFEFHRFEWSRKDPVPSEILPWPSLQSVFKLGDGILRFLRSESR